MRISQLDLKAFGHFTNRRIDFGGGAGARPDFHIAYGPNEAGKTTMSRALRAALFGIIERTTDNHLHANPNLRVGVVLNSSGGEQMAAMRRKARKNSLVRYDPLTGEEVGEAIPDERLSAWMGGLTEGLYASMFGLDHDELVAGGKALSEGKGEIGQSLFEAGAGLTSIRTLRERLAKEADDLFRPRASSSSVFKVLDHYGTARKEAKEAQTRPAEWDALRKATEEAKRTYDGARAQQDLLQKESRRLERLAAVLPDVAARSLALERLAVLGEVKKLPADATTQRLAAEARLRQAEIARNEVADTAKRLQQDLDSIALPTTILAEGSAIEALFYSLEPFRAARDAVAAANGKIKLAGAKAGVMLAAIGETLRDDLRSLIPSATLRARVQSLVTRGATQQAELAAASRLASATKGELKELNDDLADLGLQNVPASLIEALRSFEAQGNPEYKAEDQGRQAATQQANLRVEATALSAGSIEALLAMGTPLPAELQMFRDTRAELDARRQSLTDKIETIENDLAAVTGELEGLMQQGEVSTAEHLAEQRGARDGLWQKIRRKVFPADGESPAPEKLPSAMEYEMAVQAADGTADSRFADAARVSQHADLLKRLAQMRNAIELERQRLEAAKGEANDLTARWQALLAGHGLPLLGVAELTDWLAKRDLFVQRYQSWLDVKEQAGTSAGVAASVRAGLSAALLEAGLPPCGDKETLAQAIGRARNHAELAGRNSSSQKLLARKKIKAEANLAEAERQIGECRKALDEWRSAWGQSMAEIRLADNAVGEEATARLSQFEDLEDALDTLDAARADLDAAQATVARVEQETLRLCQATGSDTTNRPADAVVATLYDRFTAAKLLAQRVTALDEMIDGAAKSKGQADQAIRLAEQDLSELKAAAGCQTLADLAEAELRSSESLKLEAEVAAVETRLVSASALALQDLLAQAEGQDLVLIQAALDRASDDLQSATSQVESLHEKLLESQTALGKIDGEAIAGEAEQRAAEAAAQLSTLVANYSSARLASAILAEVIETYQQRHQGPLLARASELFATITGGRFAKVATDFDEDMTILVGVRPNGRRETVGNLSSGTRDQLFLALRLAAIESHVARQEPMPVVVDDIVINFDDASASATFRVLAELSKKTQVLFFTHHEHLLSQAASAIGAANFAPHRL